MSGSTTSGDGSSVTNIDPLFKQNWSDYYDLAQQTSQDFLGNKAPMQHVADQTQDTNRADTVLNATVNNDAGFKQLQDAQNIAGGVADYKPQQIAPSMIDTSSVLGELGQPAAQVNGRDVQYITGNASTTPEFNKANAVTAPDFQGADKVTAGNFQQADKNTIDRGSISNIDPGSVLDHLGQYKDPYQRQVIDATMSDLEHQRQLQKNSDASDAAAAGAFGNSRYGVMQANTNEAYDRTAANTLANLNSQGFTQATGLRAQDVANDLTGQQANQGADLNVFGQNAAFKNDIEKFNTAGLAARQDSDAQLKQQRNLFNAQAEQAGQQFNAQQGQATNLFNATGQANTQQFNAGQKQNMTLADLGFANTARQQTAQNDQASRMYNAQAENERRQQLSGLGLTAAQSNQGTDLAAGQSNQSAGLTGNAQDLSAAQALAGFGAQRQGMDMNVVNALNSQGQINQDQAQKQLDATFQNATAKDNRATQALQIAGAPFQLMPGTGQGGTSNTQSSGKGIGI